MKVVFHVDAYEIDTYLQFEATVKQQQEVASRFDIINKKSDDQILFVQKIYIYLY